jgi:hypothetical protein
MSDVDNHVEEIPRDRELGQEFGCLEKFRDRQNQNPPISAIASLFTSFA